MRLSIIIPVYRGKDILKELFRRISEAMSAEPDYEILLICDGCDRETLRVINELIKDNASKIQVFKLANNYGQQRALQFGFTKASGDLIITMDEDLQHDPADIIKLVKKQKEGNYDIVYGRFVNLMHNGIRNFFSVVIRRTLKQSIPSLYENYSPYRLIKRDIAIRTSSMVCPYTFIDDFLSRITNKIAFVDINHFKRLSGRSSYTLSKLFRHGLFILFAYSGIISWLLVMAGFFILAGTALYVLSVSSPYSESAWILTNTTIIGIFGAGLLLVIFSLLGNLINHRNIILNTRPVKLANEDTI